MGLSGKAALCTESLPQTTHSSVLSTAALDSNKAPLLECGISLLTSPFQAAELHSSSHSSQKRTYFSLSWQSACQIQREEGILYQDSKRA